MTEQQHRLRELAALAVNTEQSGTLDGWKPHIWHEAQKVGATAEQLKAAIAAERDGR